MWKTSTPPLDGKYYLLRVRDLRQATVRPIVATRYGHNWSYFTEDGRKIFPTSWLITGWIETPPLSTEEIKI